MASFRKISRVTPTASALLICDMQEKFRNTVKYFTEITKTTKRLLEVSKILGMKVIATAHNPCGYGPVIEELELKQYKVPVIEKMKYSMCTPQLMNEFGDRESAVICGGEVHVCILKTALDMIQRGVQVHVVVDACSSCSQTERLFGFRQMHQAGAILTTTEALVLELVGGSDHPKSEEICQLLSEPAPDTGLLNYAL